MYDYTTPAGFGDSFFVYAFQGEDAGLVNGDSYQLQKIPVYDADFVCRLWSGAQLIVLTGSGLATDGQVQVYDTVQNSWFQLPIFMAGLFPPGFAVLPEKRYIVTSALLFDLINVELAVNSNMTASVYADQMAFYGVRRIPGGRVDPGPSDYQFYEEEFAYPFSFQISEYGPSDGSGHPVAGLSPGSQYTIAIDDYDFELRRIIMDNSGASGVKATLQVLILGEVDCWLFTAVAPGLSGNAITFAVTGQGTPDLSFAISVVGNAISVQIATDDTGTATTTIAAMYAALAADPAVTALVTLSALDNAGLLFNSNYGPQNLTGGVGGVGAGSPYRSPFKMTLYDNNRVQRSNIPLLAELLCQTYSDAIATNAAYNFFPAPPILYRVDSVIRFDIYSLIPTGDTLPTTVTLLFKGVRRLRCR